MLVFLRTMARIRRRALRLPVVDASLLSREKAWFERHSYRITTRGFIHWRRLPVSVSLRSSIPSFKCINVHEMHVVELPMIYNMQAGLRRLHIAKKRPSVEGDTSDGEDMLSRLPLVLLPTV